MATGTKIVSQNKNERLPVAKQRRAEAGRCVLVVRFVFVIILKHKRWIQYQRRLLSCKSGVMSSLGLVCFAWSHYADVSSLTLICSRSSAVLALYLWRGFSSAVPHRVRVSPRGETIWQKPTEDGLTRVSFGLERSQLTWGGGKAWYQHKCPHRDRSTVQVCFKSHNVRMKKMEVKKEKQPINHF